MSTKLAKCQTKTYQLSNEPWSTLPCSKNGCTAQTHQPSGTVSFCYCTRCTRCPRHENTKKCITCGRTHPDADKILEATS